MLSCSEEEPNCGCIEAKVKYGINDKRFIDHAISHVNECADFINRGGRLSFLASHLFYLDGNYDESKRLLLNSIAKGMSVEVAGDYSFYNELLQKDKTLSSEIDAKEKEFVENSLDTAFSNLIDKLYQYDLDIRTKGLVQIVE